MMSKMNTEGMTISGVAITQEMIDRFAAKHTKDSDGCWVWQASTCGSRTRYGRISVGGIYVHANRFALTVSLGRAIMPGMIACHRCDNMLCVNPAHLYEGTYADNARDAIERGQIKKPGNSGARRGHGAQMLPKLSGACVAEIRHRLASGEAGAAVARSVGVSKSTVSLIKTGKMWRDAA